MANAQIKTNDEQAFIHQMAYALLMLKDVLARIRSIKDLDNEMRKHYVIRAKYAYSSIIRGVHEGVLPESVRKYPFTTLNERPWLACMVFVSQKASTPNLPIVKGMRFEHVIPVTSTFDRFIKSDVEPDLNTLLNQVLMAPVCIMHVSEEGGLNKDEARYSNNAPEQPFIRYKEHAIKNLQIYSFKSSGELRDNSISFFSTFFELFPEDGKSERDRLINTIITTCKALENKT